MPGLPLVPRRQPGRARVHRVRPGAAGEERVLPAVLGPAVRRPCLGRDRAPGGGRPGRGRREDRPSPAVLRPDGTAHGSRAGASRAAPPAQGPPPEAAWVQPGLPAPHARPGRRRRPARPWPPRSASPTASPRPAGGPARSGAGSARDWPSRWTATRKARTSRGHGHCPRCGHGTCAPGTSPRSSGRRACWTTTGAPPSTPGWTASSTAWPPGSAATPSAGCAPSKTAAPAAAPEASPPSTATWARRCPRCWTGRRAITTSARSPATTSRTTCAACTDHSAITPWWPSARCSGSACRPA